MNIQEWDRDIAPRLESIRGASGWICYYAQKATGAVRGLAARPAYETEARDALNLAERELQVALASVRAAQSIYDNRPVIVENFRQAAE